MLSCKCLVIVKYVVIVGQDEFTLWVIKSLSFSSMYILKLWYVSESTVYMLKSNLRGGLLFHCILSFCTDLETDQ